VPRSAIQVQLKLPLSSSVISVKLDIVVIAFMFDIIVEVIELKISHLTALVSYYQNSMLVYVTTLVLLCY
jgi:hypothetical protein